MSVPTALKPFYQLKFCLGEFCNILTSMDIRVWSPIYLEALKPWGSLLLISLKWRLLANTVSFILKGRVLLGADVGVMQKEWAGVVMKWRPYHLYLQDGGMCKAYEMAVSALAVNIY